MTLEEIQENPWPGAQAVCDLLRWSANYDQPTPAALLLDIIGYSDEYYGEPLFDLKRVSERIGYLEAGMLGEALIEYANAPGDVTEFIDEYLQAEDGEKS